jgi:uncharacterized protein (DUF1810 family)
MNSTFNMQRFVDAQEPVIDDAFAELRKGKKRSHWMWFVFPQVAGLGTSDMARHYAIASSAEASAYLQHQLLGARLVACCELVNAIDQQTAEEIFGHIDALKFRSSITLFAAVAPEQPVFQATLDKFFSGSPDTKTLEYLQLTA